MHPHQRDEASLRHAASPPARELTARFAVDPRAPQLARRFVRCLDGALTPQAFENLELLVTELVTNSIRHGGLAETGWITLQLELLPAAVRVEVRDPGRGFDPAHRPAPSGQVRGSGWGLYLVERLARRWGVHHDGETRVWFELPTAGPGEG